MASLSLTAMQKVNGSRRCHHLGVFPMRRGPLVTDQVPGISRINGQVEQDFSSFFCQTFGIFDDFSMFHSAFGTLDFEKSSNMPKELAKNEKKTLISLPYKHFSMVLPKPGFQVPALSPGITRVWSEKKITPKSPDMHSKIVFY